MRTFLQARDYLNLAMEADPTFAMPVAWAARWYNLYLGQGWSENPDRDAATAIELATRAIELDRNNALALATCGHVKSFLYRDYGSALIYFERALAACPNSSIAWILSSATHSYLGRGEEAIKHAEHGVQLSPADQSLFYYYMFLAMAHFVNGSYDEAVKWTRMSLSENPSYTATHKILIASLVARGELGEAQRVAEEMLRLEPKFRVSDYERRLAIHAPEVRGNYLEYLRRAGLPE
jgi:adenylate cyclase